MNIRAAADLHRHDRRYILATAAAVQNDVDGVGQTAADSSRGFPLQTPQETFCAHVIEQFDDNIPWRLSVDYFGN